MRVFSALSLFATLSFVFETTAGPLPQHDDTTTGTSKTTAAATAGLIESTINGKATTVEVAVPTETTSTSSEKTTAAATSTARATEAATSAASSESTTVAAAGPVSSLLACSRPQSESPICSPKNESIVNVGDTYYLTWDPTHLPENATVTILLNYANDTSNRNAWASDGVPKQKGFVTMTMDNSWLGDMIVNRTLDFILTSYVDNGNKANLAMNPVQGPTVYLSKASPTHYPAPPQTKLPSNLSLLIGLPLGLGALAFVCFGLFFGMRKHRMIGLGNVMGKRKGYGVGKSRRQRLGVKKGAIRLEEREIMQTRARGGNRGQNRDVSEDEISAIANQTWPLPPSSHGREESLGSLVGNDDNEFRREIEKQRTGR